MMDFEQLGGFLYLLSHRSSETIQCSTPFNIIGGVSLQGTTVGLAISLTNLVRKQSIKYLEILHPLQI
ncbi:hypothetical protein AQUCO_03400020v1 [Aquilegia coerulea]|uniref:Uncharacterized protein n=1 Tax=Aquilegia coerulea TaxID=218851 RepID=A0A2G5CX39_AQUCA|nr:hypothetical protein AQUCO_03400020v1 [Aquilegia coerulea]